MLPHISALAVLLLRISLKNTLFHETHRETIEYYTQAHTYSEIAQNQIAPLPRDTQHSHAAHLEEFSLQTQKRLSVGRLRHNDAFGSLAPPQPCARSHGNLRAGRRSGGGWSGAARSRERSDARGDAIHGRRQAARDDARRGGDDGGHGGRGQAGDGPRSVGGGGEGRVRVRVGVREGGRVRHELGQQRERAGAVGVPKGEDAAERVDGHACGGVVPLPGRSRAGPCRCSPPRRVSARAPDSQARSRDPLSARQPRRAPLLPSTAAIGAHSSCCLSSGACARPSPRG